MGNIITYSVLTGLIVFIMMILAMIIINKARLNRSLEQSKDLLKEAEEKAEMIARQGALEAKTQAYEIKLNAEKEIKQLRKEVQDYENKLDRREETLNLRDQNLVSKDKELSLKQTNLENKTISLEKTEARLMEQTEIQVRELERISQMPQEEVKKELFDIVEKTMENEVTAYIRDRENEAHLQGEEVARNIISLAIARYAQDVTQERTSAIVTLPSEDMKGRIIGREGRNIRAFEKATGVDLLVDDTPEIITLSSFDPVRREIARMALTTLMTDGRIQPGRIEEVVEKARKELYQIIQKTGQDTLFDLGLAKMDKEIIMIIGRLKYRYSYGQNVLTHSIEVANLAGMMAAELGLNQKLAKRAGLLHDIGKGMDFEMEGTHVELGVRLAKKHGEHPVVVNAIASHHGDTEATSAISVLVQAADAISSSREGARFESFENYIQKLENLEAIATTKEGVQRAFAIQAGRELRVMVVPEVLDDLKSIRLAREIREQIEAEMTYPGQIKVTVIRELRAIELAK